jgi:Glutamate-1-semialdehyde aminotransferase
LAILRVGRFPQRLPTTTVMSPTSLPADHVARFHAIETARFLAEHPRCVALHQQAQRHFLFGVPLHWMADAPSPVPLYVDKAQGARLFDVDGHAIIDFCLGDTGAMLATAPQPIARTLAEHGAGRHHHAALHGRA